MKVPNATVTAWFDGSIDLANDTVKALLLKDTTAYTFDGTRDATVQDVLNNADEFDGTNYSRLTLANQTTSTDNTDGEAVFDADDLTWTNLGGSQTVQAAVVYQQVGGDDTTPGDDRVIGVIDDDFNSSLPIATNGSDVNIAWDAEGIINGVPV